MREHRPDMQAERFGRVGESPLVRRSYLCFAEESDELRLPPYGLQRPYSLRSAAEARFSPGVARKSLLLEQ